MELGRARFDGGGGFDECGARAGPVTPTDSMFGLQAQVPMTKRPPLQVLCHMCGYEYGTSSLAMHQKTCAKKHQWGVEQYAPDPEVWNTQTSRPCAHLFTNV